MGWREITYCEPGQDRHYAGSQTELNERQQALLTQLPIRTAITLAEYQEQFAAAVSERQARQDLSALVEAGLLGLEGRGPASRYVRMR